MLDNLRFAPAGFVETVDPNAVTDDTQAESKPDNLTGAAVTSKEDQSALSSPVEMVRKIFLPLINQ